VRVVAAVLRVLAALAVVAAVTGQYTYSATLGPVNPTRFFGYFTIQSNLFAAAALLITAIAAYSRKRSAPWLTVVRACVTTYMATTGVVYALLLRESTTAADFNLQWADDLMHVWVPLYVVADWVIFADRKPVAWRHFWIILVYPVVWAVATLLRGSFVDGFYAYPFLNPATAGGLLAVVLYIAGIAVGIGAIAVLVVWVSRAKVVPL
jgi:hypothetical protein